MQPVDISVDFMYLHSASRASFLRLLGKTNLIVVIIITVPFAKNVPGVLDDLAVYAKYL